MNYVFLLAFIVSLLVSISSLEIDSNGYVLYCPCMGRFGNQVDQTIGAIAFAKALGRTLVLPPFIEYNSAPKATMVPFDDVFQSKVLGRYLNVVTAATFMREIAPEIWPAEQRKALCWSPRKSFYDSTAPTGCHAKEGNPFGPFWDSLGVTFVADEYYGDIQAGYETAVPGARKQWMERFPPSTHPVLSFTGAPASFPSKSRNWELQKHLKWNYKIAKAAKEFINTTLTRPFVGIHLRNQIDWNNVCEHATPERQGNLFASAQCLGDVPSQKLTKEMCSPSKNTVVAEVVDAVGKIGAKSVYVTSDKDFHLEALEKALEPYDVKVFTLAEENPQVALAILEHADHFIGNCVSTFSSIVSRHRLYGFAQPRPSSFFGFKPDGLAAQKRKIEL